MPNRTVDYAIAASVGALATVIVGYFVFVAASPGISFTYWLGHREAQVAAWAAIGVLVGAALRYLRR
jgi:hypothetical protein